MLKKNSIAKKQFIGSPSVTFLISLLEEKIPVNKLLKLQDNTEKEGNAENKPSI